MNSNLLITYKKQDEVLKLQRYSVVAENATTADGRNRTVAKYATAQSNRKNNSTCAFSAQVEN